jgi:hypothetical protein
MLRSSLGNTVTIFQAGTDTWDENDQVYRTGGLWNNFVDHQLHIVVANLD